MWEAFIELDNWKQGDWSSKTNCQLLFKTHFVIVRVEVCGGLMSITSLLLSEIAQVAATVWAVTLILPQPTTLHYNYNLMCCDTPTFCNVFAMYLQDRTRKYARY